MRSVILEKEIQKVLLGMDVAQLTNICHFQKELVHLQKLNPVLRVPPGQRYHWLHLFQTMKPVVNCVNVVNLVLQAAQVVI